jgi:hypothetical protein
MLHSGERADIKETKWFMHNIDGKLISIQPDNNRYNGGTHDNPSLTICRVGLKDSTLNYVCIVRHKDDKIESFKWRLRVIPQGMCLYIIISFTCGGNRRTLRKQPTRRK